MVQFHSGTTELRMCKNSVFLVPVKYTLVCCALALIVLCRMTHYHVSWFQLNWVLKWNTWHNLIKIWNEEEYTASAGTQQARKCRFYVVSLGPTHLTTSLFAFYSTYFSFQEFFYYLPSYYAYFAQEIYLLPTTNTIDHFKCTTKISPLSDCSLRVSRSVIAINNN